MKKKRPKYNAEAWNNSDKFMKDIPELKRCPFCGSGACSCCWPDENGAPGDFRVHCQSCSCNIEHNDNVEYFKDEKTAVDFWNKRVKPKLINPVKASDKK